MFTAVIDLGIANLSNVVKALDGRIVTHPGELRNAGKLVLPGVGSFQAVIKRMEEFREEILRAIEQGKPFLGICLGMQLLFETSEEGEGRGLEVLKGKVVKFRGVRVPHIGWNRIHVVRSNPLLEGIEEGAFFYFVHSYYVCPEEENVVACTTEHGDGNRIVFTSMVAVENVFGVQFHPEKSSTVGLKLLENFRRLKS